MRVMCDAYDTTRRLGEGTQIYANFVGGHSCTHEHEQAARRAAVAIDVEELPAAARPDAPAGVGMSDLLPDEPEPASYAYEAELYVMRQHETALLDLLTRDLERGSRE